MRRKAGLQEKPYDKCLQCFYLGNGCDGPRTSSMDLLDWCEWLRDVKESKGLTNAQIAEASDISVTTVQRVMAGNVEKDIMRSSSAALENAIIGSGDQHPCYLAFMDSVPDATKDLAKTMQELARLQIAYNELVASHEKAIQKILDEVQVIREGEQKKIDHLKNEVEYLKAENERKNKVIEKLLDK